MITANPFSLEGKTVLVTGASSGIGRQVAIESSKMGAELIITGRNQSRLDETFECLAGDSNRKAVCDFSVEGDLEKLVSDMPMLDGIVHSAGIIALKPFQYVNEKDLKQVMDVNFNAPLFLTNLLIRRKLVNKGASIVFISSISGNIVSSVGESLYSASKGALTGLVKGLALDLAVKRIRVNSVLPGMIDTGFFDNSPVSSEQIDSDKRRYPLGRYGSPQEVAYAVIYLLSQASAWITGSNILIDGGYTLL